MSYNPNDPLGMVPWAGNQSVLSTQGFPDAGMTYHTQGQPDFDWDAALAALAAQNQFNNNIASGGLKNQTQQIKNQNAYQQGLLANARAQLAQAAAQFEQTYGLQVGSLTGMFNGSPTLANLAQQAQFLGTYNGQPTLAAQNQQQQFGLQQGALTGQYQGNPTLAAQQWADQLGLNQAALTGQYQGNPTLAAQNQQFQQGVQAGALTGQYNGAPTLAAQQLAQQGQQAQAQLGLNTLQLGASLGGPSNWLDYETAAAGARQNPLLAQGVAAWADMTNTRPTGTGSWAGGALQPKTLGTLGADFGAAGGGARGMPETAPRAAGAVGSPVYETGVGFAREKPDLNATANYMAQAGMNTSQWAPNFWNSLNSDMQDMFKNAWLKSGQSPATVLSNASRQRVTQGFGA